MRTGVSILLLTLAVFAAGCGSSKQKASSPKLVLGPPVPWVDTVPPALAPRNPKARPCTSADLAVDGAIQFQLQDAGGSAVVPISNTGKQPCSLSGWPGLRVVKKGGPKQQVTRIPELVPLWPALLYPESMLNRIRPGEKIAVQVQWSNWCDYAVPGKPHVPPKAIRLVLPHGRGSLSADYNAVPPCNDGTQPSRLGIGPFQPIQVKPTAPFTAAVLTSKAPGPLREARGGLLHYRIVLHNNSPTTATFDKCPTFIQEIAPMGHIQAGQLNCKGAHAIAPGKSLAFDMQIRVPKNSPLGNNGLFWELDPAGSRMAPLSTRVVVSDE